MTTCTLILGLISCVAAGPRPSPAEAAAILTASVAPYVAPQTWPTEPSVVIVGTPGQAPLGPWAMPVPAPRVRLDGTPLTRPPAVYGVGHLGRSRVSGQGRRR